MPQPIDWTIAAAPDPDEPPLDQPPVPSRYKVSKRVGWTLAILIVAALLALGGYSLWNAYRTRQAIQRLIAAEELAGRTGDAAGLLSTTDPGDAAWRAALLQLAANHQAAPLPSQALQPLADPADAIAFTSLSQTEVRADVTRAYRAPDGAALAFTLPQFYRYTQGQWQRLAPPAEWAKPSHHDGAFASITYDAADAAFVEGDLAPYLDDVLRRACADWGCPPDAMIKLQLGNGLSLPASPDPSPPPDDEPLLFVFARVKDLTVKGDTLLLPASRLAGYPTNLPSAAWLKRAVALQALAEMATRLSVPGGSSPTSNAFLYALVARTAARLGLEQAQWLNFATANAGAQSSFPRIASNVNVMWDLTLRQPDGEPLLGLRDSAGHVVLPNDPAARDFVLRRALAVTNWLLRGQPAGAELKLLGAIKSAHDQTAWLAQGLGVSPDEAWTRLQLAVWNMRPAPADPKFALECSVGVVLASPGQITPIATVEKSGYPSLISYSPDGSHLLVDFSGGPVLIDLDTGIFANLPWLDPSFPGQFRGWLSNTMVAALQPTNSNTSLTSLHFVDVTNPQRELPTMAGIIDYSLSPDKTQAVVITAPDPQSPLRVTLAIMPALGGPLTPIDESIRPDDGSNLYSAWSPDSRSLAYLHLDPTTGRFSLRVADASTGLSHEIWSSSDPDAMGGLYGFIAWSPAGGQIAFALQSVRPLDSPAAWLGMVNADGSGLKLLQQQSALYTKLSFSADGRYLVTLYYNSRGDSSFAGTLLVYAAADGGQILELVNKRDAAWSVTGHQLAFADRSGVSVLAGVDQSPRQILAGDSCSDITWNPAS